MTPYYAREGLMLHLGNCLDVMAGMAENSVDTVLTDPPAGIAFMGKAWDNLAAHRSITERGKRVWTMLEGMVSLDFLKPWEAGFLLFTVDWASEALRVAKPGAINLTWAIPRTSDLTQMGLRLAGWEIRDTIYHCFGSGFPKSLDIGKSLDKRAEIDLEVVEQKKQLGEWLRAKRGEMPQKEIAKHFPSKTGKLTGCVANWELGFNLPTWDTWLKLKIILDLDDRFDYLIDGRPKSYIEAEREVIDKGYRVRLESTVDICGRSFGEYDITAPSTPSAKLWDGYGTALKPAVEEWIVAMKPLAGTFAQNALTHKVAGLNIKDARITPSCESAPKYNLSPSVLSAAASCILRFCHDFEKHIHAGALHDSTDGKDQAHSVCAQDDNQNIEPLHAQKHHARTSPSGGECGQSLLLERDSLFDYQICRYLSDELARLFAMDALKNETLQGDVLKCIHPSLRLDAQGKVSTHSLYRFHNDRLSSLDDWNLILSSLRSFVFELTNYTTQPTNPQAKGRWPSNLILTYPNDAHDADGNLLPNPGKDEVLGCFPVTKSGARDNRNNPPYKGPTGWKGTNTGGVYESSEGSAARFFKHCPPDAKRVFYAAKASRGERNKGLAGMEERGATRYNERGQGPLPQQTPPANTPESNHHPTVKPLSLMRYLCTLTRTPTSGVVLDPFMGSGTTGVACVWTDRDFIGIEIDPDYAEIATRRIDAALDEPKQGKLL